MLDTDIGSVQAFRKDVAVELKNADMASRTIERMKSPIAIHTQLNFSPPSP
jgi:hypothetical protein